LLILTKESKSEKKSIWLTYAWTDNEDKDVDFAAQELGEAGLDVKLDRWNLTAGKRLWEQIEFFIQDPSKSDGWVLYATQASLGSQACKEEYAYALDRALQTRGEDFPIIALFPIQVDRSLIPAGIKTRLFVSLTDPDWKERIAAAVERRQAQISKLQVEPYALSVSKLPEGCYVVEVRPRGGTWSPFIAAIPIDERESISHIMHGPIKHIPVTGVLFGCGQKVSDDGKWFVLFAQNEATPTQSYYIFCRKLPSLLIFGTDHGPQFQVRFGPANAYGKGS
jgi:hypothetical protein